MIAPYNLKQKNQLGDKTTGKYDALSLIIVELSHNALIPIELPTFGFDNSPTDNQNDANSNKPPRKFFNYIPSPNSRVEVITSGKMEERIKMLQNELSILRNFGQVPIQPFC